MVGRQSLWGEIMKRTAFVRLVLRPEMRPSSSALPVGAKIDTGDRRTRRFSRGSRIYIASPFSDVIVGGDYGPVIKRNRRLLAFCILKAIALQTAAE